MVIVLRSIVELKEALGGTDLALESPEGTTVSGLLDYGRDRWGESLSPPVRSREWPVPPYVPILVNGQTIQLPDGFGTVPKEGDDVLLLPLVGGR